MKRFKKILTITLLLIVLFLVVAVTFNYPKLNVVTGYSAKNMASSVFIAKRSAAFTDENDNNFTPVDLAEDEVDMRQKMVTTSVFGLKEQKAVYREGIGSVLIHDDFDITAPYSKPTRYKVKKDLPFPYGNLPQKDTVFAEVNSALLEKGVAFGFKNLETSKTRSVMVLYKNQIIAEHYANGYDASSKFLGWSMTKSILATLFGILQYEGKIDIQQKAGIEAWEKDERNQITIDHLLHMNSGLEWDEDYASLSDVNRMLFEEEDMTLLQLEKTLVAKPNEVWNYSSGTTNLLSGILRKHFNTYQEYLDFPYKALIDRIGMHSMLLEMDLRQYGGHVWLNASGTYPDVPRDMFSIQGFQGQRIFMIPSKDLVVVRFGLVGNAGFDFNTFLKEIVSAIS